MSNIPSSSKNKSIILNHKGFGGTYTQKHFCFYVSFVEKEGYFFFSLTFLLSWSYLNWVK